MYPPGGAVLRLYRLATHLQTNCATICMSVCVCSTTNMWCVVLNVLSDKVSETIHFEKITKLWLYLWVPNKLMVTAANIAVLSAFSSYLLPIISLFWFILWLSHFRWSLKQLSDPPHKGNNFQTPAQISSLILCSHWCVFSDDFFVYFINPL